MQKNTVRMGEKKIYKLNLQTSFFYAVAGIVSHEKIFVLSNEIKRLTELNLENLLTFQSLQNNIVKTFNVYSSRTDENNHQFFLLSNRSSEGVLIDTFKSLDYFLVLSSDEEVNFENSFLKKVKSSKLVLAISILELKTVKQKKQFEEIVNQMRT